MLTPRILAAWCSVAPLVLDAGFAVSQDYPNKPVRIVASGVGGAGDFAARLIAHGLAAGFGQQVIVDNRGGVTSMEVVSKAPADGYTLLLNGASLWLGPFLRSNAAWD